MIFMYSKVLIFRDKINDLHNSLDKSKVNTVIPRINSRKLGKANRGKYLI